MLWALDQIADHYGAWAPGGGFASVPFVCSLSLASVRGREGGMGGGQVGGAGRGGGGVAESCEGLWGVSRPSPLMI